jgi:tRNA (cytidine/uridine-2'-O-)-methyltransferase
MRVALYQPDIAGNVGAIMRLCACFAVPLDIVMPCGFAFSDKHLKRSAMDYGVATDLTRHADFASFRDTAQAAGRRIVLLTTAGETRLPDMRFSPDDILLLGSESSGAPPHVHDAADFRVRIPMAPGFRSLNIAVSTGIALGEALRQTGRYPQ